MIDSSMKPTHTFFGGSQRYHRQIKLFLYILLGIVGTLLIGHSVSAQNLNLIFQGFLPVLLPRSFPAQFGGGTNDYAGGMIIDSVVSLSSPQLVVFGNQTLSCTKQINGYYFNSARGLRMWPLSQDSLDILKDANTSYNGLTMVGNIYTACTGSPQDIVGYISYTQNGVSQGTVLFGVKTDIATNSYQNIFSGGAFTIKNFTLPDGVFYDTVVGIGRISSADYIYNMITYGGGVFPGGGDPGLANSFWNISVQGRLGLSFAVDATERQSLRGNVGQKSIIYSSDEVTSSKTINNASKNAEINCRGGNTFELNGNGLSGILEHSSSTICINGTVGDVIELSMEDISQLQGKDLIVRNSDVFLTKEIFKHPNLSLSIFIDNGNLIVQNNADGSYLNNFDANGYLASSPASMVTKGLYLQGNYIINGLLLGGTTYNSTYSAIPAKTFIHGRFASLNLPTASYENRKKQLRTMFGQNFEGINFISLTDLFTWRCANVGDYAGFGAPIEGTTIAEQIPCGNTNDIHAPSSLIVVEKNIPSIFFKE